MFFFFFQAEDGIRDYKVTGVQTCALPISALDLHERIERRETRKSARESAPAQVQVFRVVPAGTGSGRIPVGADGKPADPAAYTAELRKLENALVWASEPSNREQRDALAKFQ